MNREVEFRAWDKVKNIMLSSEDILQPIFYEELSYLDYIILKDEDKALTWLDEPYEPYEGASNYVLMQYTGLKDKNTTKAFELDLIPDHMSDAIGVIRYGEYRNPFGDDTHGGHVGFYVDWGEDHFKRRDLAYWLKVSHIIGNIYQNAEILNKTPRSAAA